MNGIISYMVFGDWLLSCFQGSSMLQHVLILHSFLRLNNVLLYRCATFCLSMPKKQTYRLFPPLERYVCISYSVMSDSLRPHGLYPTRLLCPWILQARILEWVAMTSRDLPDPGMEPWSPTLQADSLVFELIMLR